MFTILLFTSDIFSVPDIRDDEERSGRKVCGFKIVGRINELDNRWRFQRWLRKQLSLGSFGGWIFHSDLSSLPKRFLAKELYIIRSFPGNPGAILRTDLMLTDLPSLIAPQGTTAPLASECRFDRRRICNFESSGTHLSSILQMEIRSRYRVINVVIITMRRPIKTAFRSGACAAFFIVFVRVACSVDFEKRSPTSHNESLINSSPCQKPARMCGTPLEKILFETCWKRLLISNEKFKLIRAHR